MGVDHPRICDAEALGTQRLEPEVIDPGGDGALDPLVEQFLEGREEHGLHVDRQRSRRLRKVVIGGRSSFSPLSSVRLRPVASSKAPSEQPATSPR